MLTAEAAGELEPVVEKLEEKQELKPATDIAATTSETPTKVKEKKISKKKASETVEAKSCKKITDYFSKH